MLHFLLLFMPGNVSPTNLRAGRLYRMDATPLPTFKVDEIRLLGAAADILDSCRGSPVETFVHSTAFAAADDVPELVQVLHHLHNPAESALPPGRWTFTPIGEHMLLALETLLEHAGLPTHAPAPLRTLH